MRLVHHGKSLELTKNHTVLFNMNKRSIEVLDGEYYTDISKSRAKQYGKRQRLTISAS